MTTVLIVILILLLIGALPTWPHSRGWGHYPSVTYIHSKVMSAAWRARSGGCG